MFFVTIRKIFVTIRKIFITIRKIFLTISSQSDKIRPSPDDGVTVKAVWYG